MNKKSLKLVSILLTIVMVMSLVTLPAFAAVPVYRDLSVNYKHPTTNSIQHRGWMAPYGDELAHFDYYAEAGSDGVTYYFDKEQDVAHVDPDGIMVIDSRFGNPNYAQPARVYATTDNGATSAQSGNIQYAADTPYLHNFDTDPCTFSDALLMPNATTKKPEEALFENVSLATDPETGNKYMVEADSSQNYIGYRQHKLRGAYKDAGVMNSTVFIADVKISSSEDFKIKFLSHVGLKWSASNRTITGSNGDVISSVEPGWHTIKIMLNGNRKNIDNLATPYRSEYQRYAIFFDDELISPTTNLPSNMDTWLTTRPQHVIRFEGTEGIDNFKHYGSSTPHPYGVGLAEAPKSGAIVSGTSSMYALDYYTNEKTHTRYNYYISDTTDPNGSYTLVTSKSVTDPVFVTSQWKLAINTDLSGRYIKVGARVWNRGGMSPEIMSKEVYKIEGYSDDSGLFPDAGDDPENTPDAGETFEPYVIYKADNSSSPLVGTYFGKIAHKWGPGDAELRKGMGTTFNPQHKRYKYLVIEMYSAKKTYHPLNVLFYGGGGYYVQSFSIDWEGGWKQVKLPISGGLADRGNCGPRQSPTWKPYEATTINLSAALHESSRFYPDTELYVSKMYFEGAGEGQTVANDKGEIIITDYYDPDTMVDYVSMVKEKHPNKNHPRLIVTDEKLAKLKEDIQKDDYMSRLYKAFVEKADSYVGHEPIPPYDGEFDRNYFETVAKYCGLMYLLTDDDKYAHQVWIEAENLIGADVLWSNVSTGLDAAHIANGMALCYDWCYDYLSDAQRLAIRNALMRHTYASYSNIRNGGGYMGYRNNVVAANSKGFMTSLLAICDEPGYEDFCNEFINLIAIHLPQNIGHQFIPDGNYAEGIGYWGYAVYSMMFMTDAMLSAMGTDTGIQDMPGLDKTGYFPLAMRGAKLVFNFSDANRNVHQNMSPVYLYLAERYNIPALRAYRTSLVEKHMGTASGTSLPALEDLLWYDASKPYDADWRSKMQKDYFLDGLVPMISMREGVDDNEYYIAAKGGNGRIGHIQYDAGSFVLDALGNRWIHDLGAEVYDRQRDNKYYYKIRAEGHNCVVFNPEDEGVGQTHAQNEYDTYCPIVKSVSGENESYAIIDLQPSYQEKVNSYKRAYALVSDRTQFIVQDKFSAKEATEIYSYFHVGSSTTIASSDGRSLTLRSTNPVNYMRVDFITDIEDFEIGFMDAIHHLESLRPEEGETRVEYTGHDNSGYKKFYLHAENVKDATITMVFTPITPGKTVTIPEIKDMDDWDEYIGGEDYWTYSDLYINSIKDNKVNLTANVALPTQKNIILAAYKNKALVAVKSVKAYIAKNTKDYEVPGFNPKDYDEIKAFVWDDMTSTLKPLTLANP